VGGCAAQGDPQLAIGALALTKLAGFLFFASNAC
jgi:hypothetical protein